MKLYWLPQARICENLKHNLYQLKIRAQEGLYQTIIDAIVMGPAEVETHEMEEVLGIRSEDFLKSKFKRNVPAKLSKPQKSRGTL